MSNQIKKNSSLNIFTYLKTNHSYHLVDPSPWPIVSALGAFMLATGAVLYMHKFSSGCGLFVKRFILILYVMCTWWRDIIREATFEGTHTTTVQKGLRLGMILFIASEIMFFFAFFWAFFHSSIAPVCSIGGVWLTKALTLINTYKVRSFFQHFYFVNVRCHSNVGSQCYFSPCFKLKAYKT